LILPHESCCTAVEISRQIGIVIILFIMVAVTFNDLNEFVFQHIIDLFWQAQPHQTPETSWHVAQRCRRWAMQGMPMSQFRY